MDQEKNDWRGEEELDTRTIKVERKLFHFDLKQNPRGTFLKITEESSGKRDVIILPAPGIREFVEAIEAVSEGHLEDDEAESSSPALTE